MIHPLYQQALMEIQNRGDIKMTEKEVISDSELQPELKKILQNIMNDNYSRGAFCGMITNLYFDINTNDKKEPIAVDTIIKQALLIRKQAESMAFTPVTIKLKTGADDELEPEKPKLKMVM